MRGVFVPPGVSEISFRFVPFIATPLAWVLGGLALLVTACSWALLRRIDER
jgi:hypothetical protein